MGSDKILVVDDEPGVRTALQAILQDEGFEVQTAESGEDGIEAAARESFDAVLLDVWLPGIDGLETLTKLRESNPEIEVVMISGHGTIDTAVRATKLGAFDFIEKPLSLDRTLLVLRNALRQRHLEQANRQLMARLERDTEILGSSTATEKLRRQVEIAAASESPVLILGRSGSGREAVARRLHGTGSRGDRAFVEVPCAALDARASDLALFGEGERAGRIALAADGTLFLEDVDRLDADQQRRLAAVLAAGEREPGAPRIIASVGPSAEGLDGELLQQVDVVRIVVPALRDRREDVPALAERFMRELSREYGREQRRLAPEALAALQAHPWPGELRELKNLMERLLLFGEGDTIAVAELPEGMGGAGSVDLDLLRSFASLEEGMEAFQRYYVTRILTEENGDRDATAKRLGVSTATLDTLLKQIGG